MTDIEVHLENISPSIDQSIEQISSTEVNFLKEHLAKSYAAVEKKIIAHFDDLKASAEKRKNLLVEELKKALVDKTTYLNAYLANEGCEKENDQIELRAQKVIELKKLKSYVLSEQLDFWSDKYFSKDDPSTQELDSIIQNYGRLVKPTSTELIDESKIFSSEQIECSVDGIGLKQCYVNEKSKFTLTFRSKDNGPLPKSNVSFLDIFIVTSGETTSAAKSNFQTSKLNLSDKNNIGTKKKLTTNSNGTSGSNRLDQLKRCKCECTLECLAEGLYAIHYKLDKKGTYLLNVLVNKTHVGDSPFKLKCLENSQKMETNSAARMRRSTKSTYNLATNRDGHYPSLATTPTTPTGTQKNLSSSNGYQMPHSLTNGDLKKGGSPKSKSVSRSGSTSQLTNISNTPTSARKKTPPKPMNGNTGFTFLATPVTPQELKKSPTTKTDDELLINNLPPGILSSESSNNFMSKLNAASRQSQSDISLRNLNEDDFLFQIGSRGRNQAEFLNPQAVCATNDYIYISDSNNQKVDVFAHNGEFKFSLGGNLQSTAKILRRPIGIDSTSDNRILVVDYEFKCVNVFEENGKFLSKICQGKLLGPKGICVNRHDNNQIIIADSKSNCVCIFDCEGKFLNRFGNLGNKNENFAGPQYVACLKNGDIAITDFYNHCIKIFDCQGQFRFSFGSNGLNQGQFNGPTGITTDKDDNIIVVDWGNSRIQVFDKHGSFIRYINSDLNQLYGPQDIALINNTIAVSDSGNHCVKIFEYS